MSATLICGRRLVSTRGAAAPAAAGPHRSAAARARLAVQTHAARAHIPPPQIFSTPDLDLLSSACRFTLPGRCAAFGGKGLLAAAGDDGMIKLCQITPGSGESKVRARLLQLA